MLLLCCMQKDIDAVVARLDGLKDKVQKNLTEYEVLQNEGQQDRAALEDLLVQKKAAQQVGICLPHFSSGLCGGGVSVMFKFKL